MFEHIKNVFMLTILLLISVLPLSLVHSEDNIQILKEFQYGEKEYKFVILPENTPLIPSFPIDSLKNDPEIKSVEYVLEDEGNYFGGYYLVTIDAGGQIDSKVEIKYSIHTSIENPRIKMMGGLSIPYYSYVGRNVLDYKTEHKFGDNCWLTPWSWNGDDVISDSEIGAISFIRNNVQVGISNNGRYYDNPSALIAVAGKIDQALINCEKVATADLLNAPVITSFEVISGSNVVGAIDEVVVEAKATDPMGEDLAYSMYPGFSGLWGNGTFSISRIEMAGTYKYGVWVMNESHLTSFAKMELTFIEPVPVASQTPQTFNLYQNRPNPFNPATTITFSLPFSGMVRLSVYNMLGQEVTRLVDSYLPAGVHNVVFNGAGLSSGVYFYRIDSGNFSSTRKMLFIQ